MDINDSFNNIIDSTVTVHLAEHKTPRQLTSKLGKDTIIGRAKELEDIDTLLKESSSLLLINGIGGIGKSTIASYYLHSQKENLDYYGFFEGLESFTSELREPLALKQEKESDAFLESLTNLRNLKGNKLLVFDDVKDIDENQEKIEKILALKNRGYKILFTSREEIEDIEPYYLDVLLLEDAKKLFNSIYKVEDEELLEDILGYLDCHAFFVEMTAKTLKCKSTLTPEIIKEKFENGEFSTIKRKRKESFNNYLNELFSFDELDDEEILMLKQLSVLPSIEIEFEFLQEIFDKKDDEEFEEILNYLCEKGWLGYSKGSYKLHQVIKEFILFNHTIVFEELEIIIDCFSNLIKRSDDIQVAVDNRNNIIYFDALVNVFDILKIKNAKIGFFFLTLGNITRSLNIYSKAEILYYKALSIHKKILGEEHLYTVSTYNNLATLYYSMEIYEKAEAFYLKALNIWERTLGEEHPNTADLYNNLASLYNIQRFYKKAIPFYFKSLEIKEKVWGEEHTNTADSYNNLALLCQSIGDYKNTELFLIKALKIREKVLGVEHPVTAGSYNNLAEYYRLVESYNKAKPLYFKALNTYEEVLGEEHSLTANIYNNLALLYKSMGINDKVEYFYIKALKIYTKVFGEEHSKTGNSYNNLGAFYYTQKDFEKANRHMKKAVAIWTKTLPENHPHLIGSKTWLDMIEKDILKRTPLKLSKKIARNDPCPCNSGKKYKKCCGKSN
ncbi:MAG: Unknown protein [uncultured Sulfurovum sp.]|uniref:NB-ARC domain-containing protein n=1 Tax=uncultured Sulfurovum sp. TaxID=269237 RepID=A0A6S6RSV4_9BACT|nr:MAG: Unknown protein [uncultured Sulfurovum sp.]